MRHLALHAALLALVPLGCDPSFFNRDSGASDAGPPGDSGAVDAAARCAATFSGSIRS